MVFYSSTVGINMKAIVCQGPPVGLTVLDIWHLQFRSSESGKIGIIIFFFPDKMTGLKAGCLTQGHISRQSTARIRIPVHLTPKMLLAQLLPFPQWPLPYSNCHHHSGGFFFFFNYSSFLFSSLTSSLLPQNPSSKLQLGNLSKCSTGQF